MSLEQDPRSRINLNETDLSDQAMRQRTEIGHDKKQSRLTGRAAALGLSAVTALGLAVGIGANQISQRADSKESPTDDTKPTAEAPVTPGQVDQGSDTDIDTNPNVSPSDPNTLSPVTDGEIFTELPFSSAEEYQYTVNGELLSYEETINAMSINVADLPNESEVGPEAYQKAVASELLDKLEAGINGGLTPEEFNKYNNYDSVYSEEASGVNDLWTSTYFSPFTEALFGDADKGELVDRSAALSVRGFVEDLNKRQAEIWRNTESVDQAPLASLSVVDAQVIPENELAFEESTNPEDQARANNDRILITYEYDNGVDTPEESTMYVEFAEIDGKLKIVNTISSYIGGNDTSLPTIG